MVFSTNEPVVTTTCTMGESSSTPFAANISAGFRGTEVGDFEMSDDGTSISRQWAVDGGETQFEVDLRAARED